MPNPLAQLSPAALIMAVTVVVSLIAFAIRPLRRAFTLSPYNLVHRGHIHTIITSGFVHADWGHLFGNMLTYCFFAFSLQEETGPVRFVILYFVALVLSDIPTILWNRNKPEYASLGASGAITGVMFSYILFHPETRLWFPALPFRVPALIYAVLYIGHSILSSLGKEDGVNHSAHLWGAFSGVAVTALIVPGGMEKLMDVREMLSDLLRSFGAG